LAGAIGWAEHQPGVMGDVAGTRSDDITNFEMEIDILLMKTVLVR
jgi:hypothetical protein